MPTQGLPDFPKKRSLERKAARYARLAEAHRRGEHDAPVRGCKWCRVAPPRASGGADPTRTGAPAPRPPRGER